MEQWKTIIDYPRYKISTKGRVASYARGKKRFLKFRSHQGYSKAGLYIGGKMKYNSVHRLVAAAFIPNPENKPQVNHINGLKTDNRVENLEWCTASENIRHALKSGMMSRGENHHYSKLSEQEVVLIRNLCEEGFTKSKLARWFGVGSAAISKIHLRQVWKHI